MIPDGSAILSTRTNTTQAAAQPTTAITADRHQAILPSTAVVTVRKAAIVTRKPARSKSTRRGKDARGKADHPAPVRQRCRVVGSGGQALDRREQQRQNAKQKSEHEGKEACARHV